MDDGEERADFNVGEGLFLRFTGGRLLKGLAVLHEAGGYGPEATPRLDSPPTQQDSALVLGNAAHDQARILIVDRSAGIADVTGDQITRRDAQLDFGAAL